MKILSFVKKAFRGLLAVDDMTQDQLREVARVKRRLTRFPRLRHCPNQLALRNAEFKHRFGL